MSLHGAPGACIPVASASPIHVFPIHVLKHCGAHKHSFFCIYTHVIQNNLRTSQLAGFAHQLGCKNSFSTVILLIETLVDLPQHSILLVPYIYIFIYLFFIYKHSCIHMYYLHSILSQIAIMFVGGSFYN